jgi:predicted phage tail protein
MSLASTVVKPSDEKSGADGALVAVGAVVLVAAGAVVLVAAGAVVSVAAGAVVSVAAGAAVLVAAGAVVGVGVVVAPQAVTNTTRVRTSENTLSLFILFLSSR